jgi:hypothetical protein
MCGRDVEQDNLVRAGFGVTRGELGGIAGVHEIKELYTLDHAASGNV